LVSGPRRSSTWDRPSSRTRSRLSRTACRSLLRSGRRRIRQVEAAKIRREPPQAALPGLIYQTLSRSWFLTRSLLGTRDRDDEDPVIVVGLGYPPLLVEVSRYRPKLFQVGNSCPPHHRITGHVCPGPAEGFYGGRLQNATRLLSSHPRFALDGLFLPSATDTLLGANRSTTPRRR
jgi:hypothetical protein